MSKTRSFSFTATTFPTTFTLNDLLGIGSLTSFAMAHKNAMCRLTILDTSALVQKATWSKDLIGAPTAHPWFHRWSLPKFRALSHEYYTPRLSESESSFSLRALCPRRHIQTKLFLTSTVKPELTLMNFLGWPPTSPPTLTQAEVYEFQGISGRLYVSNNLNWLKKKQFPIMKWLIMACCCGELMGKV